MSPLSRCVGDVDDFADRHWSRSAGHWHLGEDFTDLLSVGSVDQLVATGVRQPAIRLVMGGEALPAGAYCGVQRIGGERLDDVADAAKVQRQVALGATVVLQSLQRLWPSVARFTADLEHEISHTVQANAYLTPPRSCGLRPHSDGHDVIVLQVCGRKQWTVDGLGDVALGAGDSLYIPAGTTHVAETGDELSLHLTIGILRRTRRQVMERLLMGCEALDVSLPLGFAHDPDGLAEVLWLSMLDATEHIGRADAAEIAAATAGRRRTRIYRQGALYSTLMLEHLGARSSVLVVDQAAAIADLDDGRVSLVLSDRTLTLPGSTRRALVELMTTQQLRVEELQGLSPASQLVLARRLILEGMITLADDTEPDPTN